MASNLLNPELDSVPQAVAQNGMAKAATGTTTETVLATVTIPKGAVRPHGRIRIWCTGQVTANTDTKTLKVKLNGVVIGAALVVSAAGTASFDIEANVVNGATPTANFGSIIGFLGAAVSQGGAAMTVDMTQAQTIQITGQLGTSTDTITLNAYSVEVFNV